MLRVAVLVIVVVVAMGPLRSQSSELPATRSLHLGHGFIYEKTNGQQYAPVVVSAGEQLGLNQQGWLQVFFSLRLNPSYVIGESGKIFAPEVGLQLGIRAGWAVADGQYLFGDISSGPHFISQGLGIQKEGFIFSDNFSAGWMGAVNDRMLISLQTRFRHLSNAGLYEPNNGIDNWLLIGGIHQKK